MPAAVRPSAIPVDVRNYVIITPSPLVGHDLPVHGSLRNRNRETRFNYRLVGEENVRVPHKCGGQDRREGAVDERDHFGHSSDQDVHVGETVRAPRTEREKVRAFTANNIVSTTVPLPRNVYVAFMMCIYPVQGRDSGASERAVHQSHPGIVQDIPF